MKDLYIETYKIFLEEIKDTSKWKDPQMFMNWKIILLRCPITQINL